MNFFPNVTYFYALKPLIDHSNYISATKNMDFNLEFFLKVASDLRLC